MKIFPLIFLSSFFIAALATEDQGEILNRRVWFEDCKHNPQNIWDAYKKEQYSDLFSVIQNEFPQLQKENFDLKKKNILRHYADCIKTFVQNNIPKTLRETNIELASGITFGAGTLTGYILRLCRRDVGSNVITLGSVGLASIGFTYLQCSRIKTIRDEIYTQNDQDLLAMYKILKTFDCLTLYAI